MKVQHVKYNMSKSNMLKYNVLKSAVLKYNTSNILGVGTIDSYLHHMSLDVFCVFTFISSVTGHIPSAY